MNCDINLRHPNIENLLNPVKLNKNNRIIERLDNRINNKKDINKSNNKKGRINPNNNKEINKKIIGNI